MPYLIKYLIYSYFNFSIISTDLFKVLGSGVNVVENSVPYNENNI